MTPPEKQNYLWIINLGFFSLALLALNIIANEVRTLRDEVSGKEGLGPRIEVLINKNQKLVTRNLELNEEMLDIQRRKSPDE